MSDVPCFVGIDVAKAQLDIALRPSGERWAVANDASGVAGLQLVHKWCHPAGIVGDGPSLPGGAYGNVQLGFGHINTDKAWHITHQALLSARPCRYGLHGTKQLCGLGESRT